MLDFFHFTLFLCDFVWSRRKSFLHIFLSQCNVVVGNLVGCARSKYGRIFWPCNVVIEILHVIVLEGNLAHARFLLLQCCYCQYASVCARSKFSVCYISLTL